jgi:leucyl/phenylalanyl-tRNA--protein transferase
MNLVWHFATGYLPDFLNKRDGDVGWVRWSHRGIQFLDNFAIPRKQRPYVNSPKFELRFNDAFEEVIRACADPTRPGIARRAGESWITEDLIQALLAARRQGFAHSFETWQDGKLAGGIWGVQVGGLVTMSSMFSRMSNASKSAMARTMMRLKERGFAIVDMGMVPDHLVHFGAEWVPRWKYEEMLPALIRQRLSIDDRFPCPELPWLVKAGEPVLRLARKLGGTWARARRKGEPAGEPASRRDHSAAAHASP